MPNFDEISQSITELLLLRVSENGRGHITIIIRVSTSTHSSSSAWQIASEYQISSKSVNPRRSYDVISIFQDGGYGVANLLSVACLVTELVWEDQELSAY